MDNVRATARSRILIVGKDRNRAAELGSALVADGYLVRSSTSGHDALEQSRIWRPQLIIADGSLTDIKIPSLCTVLRASGNASSIMVRLLHPSDFVEVLDAGADDCMDGGCSTSELKARVRSKLRTVE